MVPIIFEKPYKVYKEKMDFSLWGGFIVNYENLKPQLITDYEKENGVTRLLIIRDLITNNFRFVYKTWVVNENLMPKKFNETENIFSKIVFGNKGTVETFNRKYIFGPKRSRLTNSLVKSFYVDSNYIKPEKTLKTMWPLNFSTWGIKNLKISLIGHNSFNKRTFFIPSGKTIKLMAIKNIEFTINNEFETYDLHFTYNSIYIKSMPPKDGLLKSLFKIVIIPQENELGEEWLHNNLLEPTLNTDMHPTKVEGLKLSKKETLTLGADSQGIASKYFEQKIVPHKWDIFSDKTYSKKYYSSNFEIKGSTKYNYHNRETEISNSLNSKEGYIIPYEFSGSIFPKSKFSFNDSFKDIYLTTEIKVDKPFLNKDFGKVKIQINETKPLKKYNKNFLIPASDIELLFKKNELEIWEFEKWSEQK
ncbi:MAG: hypothetical protein GY679_03075 [Mycoplasma sp.]|nr:hypothetical protein [Mycoplasma sp.]